LPKELSCFEKLANQTKKWGKSNKKMGQIKQKMERARKKNEYVQRKKLFLCSAGKKVFFLLSNQKINAEKKSFFSAL
jgi:hypothetical protein